MGTPTPEQRRKSQERARAKRILTGGPDGLRWIAPVPAEKHGRRWVRNFYKCECRPCMDSDLGRASGERRAKNRREWMNRREYINDRWVATHLRPEQHGTATAVDYYGCGCEVCVAGRLARDRKRKGRA